MSRHHRVIRALIVAVGIVAMMPTATTRAHSLDSTTIAVRLTDDTAEATVSLPLATLAEALDATDATGSSLTDAEVIAYVDQHLVVTDADGAVWDEIYASPSRTVVEGIDSFEVMVTFDGGAATPDELTIAYDAIIESFPDHQAVVVLTDSTGDISTPGIFDDTNDRVTITDGGTGVAVGDMIQYGFEHVLDGADHLLFLVTLLLPAPLIAVGRRWQSAEGWRPASIKVVHVVTAFTIGHSVTLIASALGWVRLPSRPVEVVIAISVGISALHAIRPLARNGEVMIAAGFGLVHGLAFAGILADLGLEGRTSLGALLSFNIGIELAQLAATALLFPSLYLASRTRWYPAIRVTGASMALAAAVAWALERLDVLPNPFTPTEEWVPTPRSG